MDAPINLQSVGIISSGGTIAFLGLSNGSSFDSDSSMGLTDTGLVLETDLAIPYLNLSGSSTLLQNNGTLTPAYLEIGIDGELDFTDIATNDTILRLAGDSNITKTGELILKEINIEGHILTLNPDIVDLTSEAIYFTNYNSESADYLTNAAELRAEGVNINMTKRLWVDRGKITMGGGTLSLVQGGGLADIGFGEIDLTNSTLSLSGPFMHDAGILTTSASTLRLNANTVFRLGSDVTFETYEPNGWGLFLNNNFVLTLGAVGTETIIQPSQDSLTSGYVSWYHDCLLYTSPSPRD